MFKVQVTNDKIIKTYLVSGTSFDDVVTECLRQANTSVLENGVYYRLHSIEEMPKNKAFMIDCKAI